MVTDSANKTTNRISKLQRRWIHMYHLAPPHRTLHPRIGGRARLFPSGQGKCTHECTRHAQSQSLGVFFARRPSQANSETRANFAPLQAQKNPRVRKIRVRNSGAGNGCAKFMDTWKKCVLSAGKAHVRKIPLFFWGGGGFGGGGVPILFLWARGFFWSAANPVVIAGEENRIGWVRRSNPDKQKRGNTIQEVRVALHTQIW